MTYLVERSCSESSTPKASSILSPGTETTREGAWRYIDSDLNRVEQLRRVSIKDLPRTPGNTLCFNTIRKYRTSPPLKHPIVFLDSQTGKYVVDDGNHRIQAARERGETTTLVWVRRGLTNGMPDPRLDSVKRVARTLSETKLIERSYSESDIPKHFYRIFYFVRGSTLYATRLQQILDHQIPRAGGIADSLEIRKSLKHDSMLIMPGSAVLAENKLSRVLYSNPNYLVTNRMQNLKRVVNEADPDAEVRLLSQIIEDLDRRLAKPDRSPLDFFSLSDRKGRFLIQQPPIFRNTGDILKYIRSQNPFAEFSRDWESYRQLQAAIKRNPEVAEHELASVILSTVPVDYRSEGEWILKDKVLHIPHGSEIQLQKTTLESLLVQDPQAQTRLEKAGYRVSILPPEPV